MKDALARLALNESLTNHEQVICDTVMNLLVDSPTIDGLVVLVAAINRKASLRGLNLRLDLTRPSSRRKSNLLRQFEAGVPADAVFKWPDIGKNWRKMGPIETELRHSITTHASLGDRTYAFYQGAKESLRFKYHIDPDDDDIMSEAIEAAEALGL